MRNYLLISIALWLNACTIVYSQSTDLALANTYLYQADSLIEKHTGVYQKAIDLAEKAFHIYKKQAPFSKQDSLIGETYALRGIGYMYLEQYEQGLYFLNKEKAIIEKALPQRIRALANNYNNSGLCEELGGNYDAALSFYKKALAIYDKQIENNTNKDQIANTLNNMAICYMSQGNYAKALHLLERVLQLKKDIKAAAYMLAYMQNNQAICYQNLKAYPTAIAIYQSILNQPQVLARMNPLNCAKVYQNTGTCQREMGDFQAGLRNCQQALAIIKKHYETTILQADILLEIAQFYIALEDHQLAEKYIKEGVAIKKEALSAQHPDMLKVRLVQAGAKAAINDYAAAIEWIDKGINAYALSSEPAQTLSDLSLYLEALHQKGNTFYNWYQWTKDTVHLAKAMLTIEASIHMGDHIRKGYHEVLDKQNFLDDYYQTYQNAVDICYLYWDLYGDSTYLYKAFEWIEKSKSILLLDNLQVANAKAFGGIPANVLAEERKLQTQLLAAEKTQFEAQQTKDSLMLQKINPQLFVSRQAYEQFTETLEKDYPTYYQLRYHNSKIDLRALRKDLDDQMVISYFVSQKHIYALLLDEKTIHLHQLGASKPIQKAVQAFSSHMDEAVECLKLQQNLDTTYAAKAFDLYQYLVAPIADFLPEKILIIPHDVLEYLPFDALLSQLPKNAWAYRTHAYLLQKYQISYAYSLQLWQEMKGRKSSSVTLSLIAFAPDFEAANTVGNSNQLVHFEALKANVYEVKKINDFINGTIYLGAAASVQTFREQAKYYKIIHLATHAYINPVISDYAYMAFAKNDTTGIHERVYTKDLYNMKLQADMVVLSACETAKGIAQKGEGMISLARGFSYAGVKSLLTTLWRINDKTTAQLMGYFYKNIKANKAKDAALRAAKQEFLQENRHQLAHPVYWAAFVPMGDMNAISLPSNRTAKIWYLLSGIWLIAILSVGILWKYF